MPRSGRLAGLQARPLRLEPLESRQLLAADVELVQDINQSTVTISGYASQISAFLEFNDSLYFTARWSSIGGSVVWKSDGTAAGTAPLFDVAKPAPFTSPTLLGVFDGTLYLRAESTLGVELWKSDGTTAGTVLVKDVAPGSESSSPWGLRLVGGELFFLTTGSASNSTQLWKSDGTEAGTTLVRNLPTPIGNSGLSSLTEMNGVAYFTASDGAHGRELWRTDGTAEGTFMLFDLRPNAGSIDGQTFAPAVFGGRLYFFANDGATGGELWRTDGSTVELVKDIAPGGGTSSNSSQFLELNGSLYFGANGDELWKTDGTTAGTALVKDLGVSASTALLSLTLVGDKIFFRGDDGVTGLELWVSDGTTEGTRLVKDTTPGLNGGANSPRNASLDGIFYFVRNFDLWRSDGTEAGTYAVKEDWPIQLNNLGRITAFKGKLYFDYYVGNHGSTLWTSDGTTVGTTPVRDLLIGNRGSIPEGITEMNGSLYFKAGWTSRHLFRSDGTDAGTTAIATFPTSTSITALTNVSGTLFFRAGSELWRSDGTAAGTIMLKELGLGPAGEEEFVGVNGTLYFSGRVDGSGYELWKSDGTVAGTVIVKDIAAGNASSNPRELANMNGTLYFSAYDGIHSTEPWKSDGTAAGTTIVKNIDRYYYSDPADFTWFNGAIYFTANGDSHYGRELWRSDGTEAGTMMLRDIGPGDDHSGITGFLPMHDALYFIAVNGANGIALWKSDGSAAGTIILKDFGPNSRAWTEAPVNVNGTLMFFASDGVHGLELWRSDGTVAGTMMVLDLPGSGENRSLSQLTVVNGKAYYTSNYEMWVSDGSATGTMLLADVNPHGGSFPDGYTGLGDAVYFSAIHPLYGRELFKVRTDVPIDLSGDYSGDGLVDGADFLVWQRRFGAAIAPAGGGADGDGDGIVGAGDLDVWRENFGATGGVVASDTAVGVAALMAEEETNDPEQVAINKALAEEIPPLVAAHETTALRSGDFVSPVLGCSHLFEGEGEQARRVAAQDALFAAGDLSALFAPSSESSTPWQRSRRRR